jgi:hypothetical protein
LVQSLHGAAAGVEDELFAANLDQRARTEAVEPRRRRARSQQSHAK